MDQRVLVAILFSLVLLLGAQNVSSFPDEIMEESLSEDTMPIVDSPLDLVYSYGDTGNSITWKIFDDYPSYWLVFKDSELIADSSWHNNNETVVVNVDGLDSGTYQYLIVASDSTYNSTDEVIVSVLSGAYEIHAPLSIHTDANFHTIAAAENWTGYGNETHPYVIEHLYIQAIYDCIYISDTTLHFVVRNCTFVETTVEWGIGISINNVGNGTFENCTFLNLWVGCIAWNAFDCEWKSNIFGNVQDGIWILESENCYINYNTFYSGGLYISGYFLENWVHEITENTVGGKILGYFSGLNGDIFDVSNYGQVIIANCSDVSLQHGVFEKAGSGILVGFSTGCVIEDCQILGGRIGVYVERSDEMTFHDIRIHGTSEFGIQLNESVRCVVDTCVVSDSGYDGIILLMAQNATVINNKITGSGGYGLGVFISPYSFLQNNTIDHNVWGIGMGDCMNTDVIANKVRWNSEKGFDVWWCENCVFYDNEIGFNGVENAYDDYGINNTWDNGESKGNMWSDYSGTGYYYISGTTGSVDHYPDVLIYNVLPLVEDTEDFDYIVGTTGHVIEWIAASPQPLSYQIYKDDVLNASDIWNGESIVVEIDGLSVGHYNFTLEVFDTNMNTASDCVMVTVRPESTTTPTATTNTTDYPEFLHQITLVISIGSVIVIVVVAVAAFRSRKGVI